MALPKGPLVDARGNLTAGWLQWFAMVDATVEAQRAIGENRPPPERAYLGMRFFDVTLGIPIYAAAVQTADSGGVTWVDGAGNSV